MHCIEINGGKPLCGTVSIQGAKNSVLPILAASVLTGGVTVIQNCPRLQDVHTTVSILRDLGCEVRWEGTELTVNSSTIDRYQVKAEAMRSLRASILFLGALLARTGRAEMSMPGGCSLGARPVDIHLWAMQKLGAKITNTDGYLSARNGKPAGTELVLPLPSVGATENIMLYATACEGETVIVNAAREPEIEDLQTYLIAAGYRVSGAGTPVVRVTGAPRLRAEAQITHHIVPDRIVTATWLCAAASAGGEIRLEGAEPQHVYPVIQALQEAGCSIDMQDKTIEISRKMRCTALRQTIRTAPFPGFPTDAQPLLIAALAGAAGQTVLEENIFPDRFRYVKELQKMGAKITVSGKYALCSGVDQLHGAEVSATDLRGGAALVLAGLAARGKTVVRQIEYIDRGYEHIEETLRTLGADVRRTEEKSGVRRTA